MSIDRYSKDTKEVKLISKWDEILEDVHIKDDLDDTGWETIWESLDELNEITSQTSPKEMTESASVNVIICWLLEGVPEDILYRTSGLISRDTLG